MSEFSLLRHKTKDDPEYIVSLQTHIYRKENDQLKAIAKAKGMTKDRLIHKIIEEYIANNKE